ncbi:hypothetical protein QM716_28435 [Rhodococcus sp. IEGM 1409]|uniref:hypothetical protein n=1 Tax=Rhodococcus sp. IEGM 1409 TaxID=3047082 RepID=UPI0024B81696|nr:hypothetical protein [Rhodococcus sp. IEGM 1409]MDI9903798.1 hypothetical protein [Rhodococcus sp. IEGM 1409]
MVAVRSTRYPQLIVFDLGVRFVDGVAEVTDKKTLDALAAIEGIEVPEPPRAQTAAEKAKAKKEAEAKAKADAEAEKAALEEWLAAEAQWTAEQNTDSTSDEK